MSRADVVHPSVAVPVLVLTLLLIVADSNNGAKANPVLNHENQLRNKLNQIDRDGKDKPSYIVSHSKSLTNFGEQHSYGVSNDKSDEIGHQNSDGSRAKRHLDFNIDADHEEGIGTDLVATVSATLYKSANGDTRVDGTARYSQHFGDYSGHGNAKVGGSLHLSHNY